MSERLVSTWNNDRARVPGARAYPLLCLRLILMFRFILARGSRPSTSPPLRLLFGFFS